MTATPVAEKRKKSLWMKLLVFLCVTTLYLASTVPVGLFLYSLKSDIGINIFTKSGFTTYMACLTEQAEMLRYDQERKAAHRKRMESM